MANRRKKIEATLLEFPENVRPVLLSVVQQSGRLTAGQCVELKQKTGLKIEELAIRLLPLVKCFAVAPVSGFEVGAIALAGSTNGSGQIDLFFGSNMEFPHLPLNQSIHAEQSAALNAWHQGADHLQAIAVSETPCGFCRQFLNEFENASRLPIIRPVSGGQGYQQISLSELLPQAFGPQDLGHQAGLMKGVLSEHKFTVISPGRDRVIAAALSAAQRSYAPYSRNLAGCAIQTVKGEIFSGRSVESAAYSPSLTPLQTAILRLNASTLENEMAVRRVVLVEKPGAVSQRKGVQMLLEAWKPEIDLEYYSAV